MVHVGHIHTRLSHMPIGILEIYRLLFLCLFACPQIFCNGYLRRGLTQSDEIWQDDRSGWVTGHLRFWWTLAVGLAPRPKSEKFCQLMSTWADTLACMQLTAIGMWGYTPVRTTGILVNTSKGLSNNCQYTCRIIGDFICNCHRIYWVKVKLERTLTGDSQQTATMK